MPELFEIRGYKIYFWSNEGSEPIHVHIAKGKPTPNGTKVWILSNGGISPGKNTSRIPKKELGILHDIISRNAEMIIIAWCKHISSAPKFLY